MRTDELRTAIMRVMDEKAPPTAKLQAVCDLLKMEVANYDWVGYYLVEGKGERRLVLGPFSGEPTEHTSIAFGEGICGQAAGTLKVFVVDDVEAESNYLSCSPSVKSEFVAPVMMKGVLVGELDIDSHTKAAFKKEDAAFLGWVADMTAPAVAGAAGLAE